MKAKNLFYITVLFIFSFFLISKPSEAFAQTCWLDHHLCYADVGCTVGRPCSAPICHPDGGDYGHLSNPQRCSWCAGYETGNNNCLWYDVHFCGVEGCPDCSLCFHEGDGDPEPPTCSMQSCPSQLVTNQEYTFNAVASDSDGSVSQTEIYSTLQSGQNWTNQCSSSSSSCSSSVSFSSPGSYYVVCNAKDNDETLCTGNPWCEWAPNPPSSLNCAASGWSDCTANDVCSFSVVTPTPYIKANLENPQGDPVSREICPVTCGMYGCYTENPPACSTTNSYTFDKPTTGWNYKGAGVTLSDDIVISVNPDPGGGQAGSRPGYHYYSWPDWSDGERQITFVLGPAPKTWTIETEAVCTNGIAHSKRVKSWHRIWPPNPVQDTTLASQVGPKTFDITSTNGLNNIYVGMYAIDEPLGWLETNPPPPHSAITYSDYWEGIPNAKWDRENLPEDSYRIEFQAPLSWCPTPTPIPTPIPGINFYLHEVDNTNACTNSTSSYSNPVGSAVPINESGAGGQVTSFTAGSGFASYTPSEITHNYTISPPSDWACACSISGSDQSNTCAARAYNETIQWSITKIASPWWQTKGGNVHSEANINVIIPPLLTQQLSLSDNGAVGVITSGGAIGNNLIDAWQYSGNNFKFNFDDNPIDYEFFWLQAGGPNTKNIPNTIGQGDFNSGDLYYGGENTDIALNNGNWNVIVNQKQVVVFVDGDLNIPLLDGALTLGPQNAFLAFIVSGDINIETGHKDPYDNNEIDLNAVFIADGDINIQGDIDRQFVGKGVFAAGVDGGGNVIFNRDLGINNNDYPPVLFIWDPELVLNAPQILMQNYTRWHEVAPVGN